MYKVIATWLYPDGTEGSPQEIGQGHTAADALRRAADWADAHYVTESSTVDERGKVADVLDLTLHYQISTNVRR